ncbi:MAG: hypothetical protein WDO56_14615 [Gammaproteobacteria bacterium]
MNRMSLSSSPRTAAEWFAARLGPRDAEAEHCFAEWLAQDPKNAEEYSLCGLTWEISESAAAGLESHGTVPPRLV